MSEEALLVMKMVQDGKLSPEQGVDFLKALNTPAPTPPTPPSVMETPVAPQAPEQPAAASWGSVEQMRSAMAEMQQKLAEAQAKLSAAEAQQNAVGSDGSHKRPVNLPFGLGTMINIPMIIDEAVRGLSAVKSEVVIGAKSAARQAQKEARRLRREAMHGSTDFKFDFRFNGVGDSFHFEGASNASSTSTLNFTVDPHPSIAIANEYGDVRVSGTSQDGTVHVKLDKESWASSEQAQKEIDSVSVLEERGDDGEVMLRVVSETPSQTKLRVQMLVEVPVDSTVSVISSRGDILCEKLGTEEIPGYLKSVETHTGDIAVMQVRGTTDASGSTRIHSGSGDITLTQWIGGSISVNAQSGDISLDMVNGADFDLHSKSGDVDIKTLKSSGKLSIEAHSGDIDLSEVKCGGQIKAKSMSGNVTGKEFSAAEVVLDSASGDVQLINCSAPDGKLAIISISGNVSVTGSEAKEVVSNSTSGDCLVELKRGVPMNASSVSGNVRVSIPPDSSGFASMSTISGSIKSEFDFTDGDDSKRFMSGKFGPDLNSDNLPKIAMQTVSGDINLRKIK